MISATHFLKAKNIDQDTLIYAGDTVKPLSSLLKDYARLLLVDCKEITTGDYNEHPYEFYEKIDALNNEL